jgi:hypothetical protein
MVVREEPTVAAEKHRFLDPDEFTEMAFDRGWTDGTPVFVPTEKKVLAILDYLKRPANESLGVLEPGEGNVTIASIAIQCAMAGCKPEYVPVVITAMEAILDEDYHILNSVSTFGGPPVAIISGPVVEKIGLNYGDAAVAGSGNRANGSIARAIRLIQWNIGLSRPGDLAKCVLGQPDRWGHVIAERPQRDGNPWSPFHVGVASCDLGPEDSAVSVLDAHGTYIFSQFDRSSPEALERSVQRIGVRVGELREGAVTVVVLNPDTAKLLADGGWSKERFRQVVWENTFHYAKDVRGRSEAAEPGVVHADHWGNKVDLSDDNTKVYHMTHPSHLYIMVSGGSGGGDITYEFTGGNHSRRNGKGLVTKKINWSWD